MQDCSSRQQFIREMERLVLLQQEHIAVLKLVAYAADAMRVLTLLERHADISKAADDMLKSICPDWRNPGSNNQTADVITFVLNQVIFALHKIHAEMERVCIIDGH